MAGWVNSRTRAQRLTGRALQRANRRILERDAYICYLCGLPGADTVDHVLALARPLGCGCRQHLRHDGPADGLPWEDVPLGEGRRGQASVGTDGLLDPGVDLGC